MNLEAKLHVDGVIQGAVETSRDVTVGLTGRIDGDVVAKRMVVCGEVSGNVQCDTLEIVASGIVSGDVVCGDFVIEKGGRFRGESRLPEENSPSPADRAPVAELTAKNAGVAAESRLRLEPTGSAVDDKKDRERA